VDELGPNGGPGDCYGTKTKTEIEQVDEYNIMHTYIIDNHEDIESVIYSSQLKHKGVKLDNTLSKIQKFSLSMSCLTGQLFRDLRDRCRAAQAYLIGYRMQS